MQIRSKKLPRKVADTIEDQCYKIPWLFQKDGTYSDSKGRKKFPCFTMLLCKEPNEQTQHYKFFPWEYIDGVSLMLVLDTTLPFSSSHIIPACCIC